MDGHSNGGANKVGDNWLDRALVFKCLSHSTQKKTEWGLPSNMIKNNINGSLHKRAHGEQGCQIGWDIENQCTSYGQNVITSPVIFVLCNPDATLLKSSANPLLH